MNIGISHEPKHGQLLPNSDSHRAFCNRDRKYHVDKDMADAWLIPEFVFEF